jgi:CelD/BcsL family acetyltransferase involved in cellulose biosynthesis
LSRDFSVDVIRPDELGTAERELWRGFRASAPALDSPYFDVRYTLAAGSVAPHGHVAVLHRRGTVVGFFPFQRRGGMIQPLGAPMTDYHGVIARPDVVVDMKALVEALRGRRFRFNGLRGSALASDTWVQPRQTMATDLSGGFEAWLQERQARYHKFFKGKRRCARGLERDVGPISFSWRRQRDADFIDYVIGLKRAQYRRTGRHDIFACGWTQRLLHRLREVSEPDFGLGFAELRAGDTRVSAEVGLRGGATYHLWMPVYETAYARYGPGMLMTIESMRAVSAEGVVHVDFGQGDAADYKAYFADAGSPVLEGEVRADGLSAHLSRLADQMLGAAPRPLDRLATLRDRVRRRLDVIGACETDVLAWCGGAALAFGVMAQGAAPTIRTHLPSPRRSDEQPDHSGLVRPAEDGLRAAARHLRPPAA